MLNLKLGLSAGFLALVVGAHALELGLVVDANTKRIERFDTFTGNSLGSFGSGYFTTPTAITIRGTTAYVADAGSSSGTKIRKFNYNTGEYLGSFNIGPQGSFIWGAGRGSQLTIGPDGAFYYTANPIVGTVRFNEDGSQFGWINSLAPHTGVATGGDGRMYSLTAGGSLFGAPTTSFPTSGGVGNWPSSLGNVTSTSSPQQMQYGNGRLYFANSNVDSVGYVNLSNTERGGYNIDTLMDDPTGLAFSHGNTLYVAGKTVGGASGLMLRMDAANGDILGTFGSSYLKDPISVAILAAPEPGSLVAMGIAGLLLIRRRKN